MGRVLRGLALTAALWGSAGAAFGSTGAADLLVLSAPGSPALLMYGPAGRALGSGPAAVLGNPARIGDGFSASGGRWNLSTTTVSAAGGISPGDLTVAAGLTYVGRGGLVRRDASGQVTGEYAFSAGSALTGVAMDLGARYAAGVAAGLAWEDPGTGAATGITASIGAAGEPADGLRVGASLTGLGAAPSWNGIRKEMPLTLSAGAEWTLSGTAALFAGTEVGFHTASGLGGGLRVTLEGFGLAAGYEVSPGESEITGFFGGISYAYVSGGTYLIQAGFAQRKTLDWPVTAGISAAF